MQSARLQLTKHDFLRGTHVEGLQLKRCFANDAEFGGKIWHTTFFDVMKGSDGYDTSLMGHINTNRFLITLKHPKNKHTKETAQNIKP